MNYAWEEHINHICSSCGSTESQTFADARTLGLVRELQGGVYACCQIVTWADEQWLAWAEAAQQDGKSADDIMNAARMSGRGSC
jgi:hypothetical protein